MTGLLELYNKKLKESKQKLTEADVVDPAQIMKDELASELADPAYANVTNEAWNDLFKKYQDQKTPNYSVVKVKDLVLKSDKKAKTGYVKYNASSTGTDTKHKFLFFGSKKVDTVESGKVEIVDNAADASIFTEEGARDFINAIKRNKDYDLSKAYFSVEKMDSKVADSSSALSTITNAYFTKLCGVSDDSAELFIRDGIRVIVNIARKRNSPLVGNPLLDALANGFKVVQVRNIFKVNNISVTTLANILAKGMMTVSALKKLDTFKAVICFNNNLYSYSVDQINDLFNIYGSAKRLTADEIGITALKGMAGIKLAKHLLMNEGSIDDNDAFANVVLGNVPEDSSEEDLVSEISELGKTVTDNDGNLLKWGIRSPNQAKLLLDKVNEESDDETDKFFLQVIRGTKVIVHNTSGDLDSEESTVTVESKKYLKGDVIRLVFTDWTNRENVKAIDKFASHLDLFTKDILSDKFKTDDGKVTFEKEVTTAFEFKFAVTGSKYDLFDVKLVGSTEDASDTTSDDETTEETPKEPEASTTPTEATIDKTGFEEVEPEGTLEGDVLRNVSVEVGDVVTGTDGKEYQVKPETLGDGKWDIKAGTKIFRKPVDLNHLSSGKSIGELLASRDVFRNEYTKLTPSERTKIKSIVNPAWLPKA